MPVLFVVSAGLQQFCGRTRAGEEGAEVKPNQAEMWRVLMPSILSCYILHRKIPKAEGLIAGAGRFRRGFNLRYWPGR